MPDGESVVSGMSEVRIVNIDALPTTLGDTVMTPRQIELVEQTFAMVRPIALDAAELFYGRLFTLAPTVRPMFPEDLTEQKKKLMAMLGMIVASLRQPDALGPMLRGLGERHVSYGATTDQFSVVGEALLWTLEQGLGAAYTNEVAEAWIAAYGAIATTMSTAMRGAAAQHAAA